MNAKLPAAKRAPSPDPEPTGINFVELLQQKKEPDKEE